MISGLHEPALTLGRCILSFVMCVSKLHIFVKVIVDLELVSVTRNDEPTESISVYV